MFNWGGKKPEKPSQPPPAWADFPNKGYYNAGTKREPSPIVGYLLTHGARQDRNPYQQPQRGQAPQAPRQDNTISPQHVRAAVATRLRTLMENRAANLTFSVREFMFHFEMADPSDDYVNSGAVDFEVRRSIASLDDSDRSMMLGYADMYEAGMMADDMLTYMLLIMIWNDGHCNVDNSTYNSAGDRMALGADGWMKVIFPAIVGRILGQVDLSAKIAEFKGNVVKGAQIASDPELRARLQERLGMGARWWTPQDGDHEELKGVSAVRFPEWTKTLGRGPQPLMWLGKVGVATEDNAAVIGVYGGDESLLAVGGPGSGKTHCLAKPGVITTGGGAVILDLKGTIFKETASFRCKFRGPVVRYAPLEDDTACFNPFDYVSRDAGRVWTDSRYLASLLVTRSDKVSDEFWQSRGEDYITALICTVALREPDENRNIDSLLDYLSPTEDQFYEYVAFMQSSDVKPLVRAGNALSAAPERTRESVYENARSMLRVLEDDRVSRSLSHSTWAPQMLRERGTLYVCLPPNVTASEYAPLLRLVIGLQIKELQREVPDRETMPVTFFLDEMPQLGKFEPVENGLELGREFKLRFWLFAQNLDQIRKYYEAADSLIGNCRVRCFMNPDLPTAEMLERALGETEDMIDGRERPLAKVSELMGDKFADSVIVLSNGTYPANFRKLPYHLAFDFSDLSLPPPKSPGIWISEPG